MSWIPLAISAHFFWALTNIGDKYLIGNRYRNPFVYLFVLNILGLIAVFLIPFVEFQIPDPRTFFWLFIASALYFYGGLPYVRAVQMEEISRINIWWNLIPIFAFFLEWIIFGKTLLAYELAGFMFLVCGAFVASVHPGKKNIVLSKAVLYMLASCAAFAGYAVIFSFTAESISFVSGFIWVGIISFFLSAISLLYLPFGRIFFQELKMARRSTLLLSCGTCIIDRAGIYLNQWALSLGAAALVYAFEGFQVIFVFIVASFISILYPSLLKEDLSRKNTFIKVTAVAFMIAGLLILSFGAG